MELSRSRAISWAMYGVALLLIVTPSLDALIGIGPPQMGTVTWRFGALGVLSRALMTPILGLLLGVLTAAMLQHRAVLRVLAVLTFGAAVLLMGAMGMLTIDAIDARGQVAPEAMRAFNIATVIALLKYGAGATLCGLMAFGARGLSRKSGSLVDSGDMLVSARVRS